MPRDLADVLHYFLPDADDPGGGEPLARPEQVQTRLALPLIGVPIGDRDLVRAALTWNLAIEMARLGGQTVVVAPTSAAPTPLWPTAGIGPAGCELIRTSVSDLAELERAALAIAAERSESANRGGAVFVRVPPHWIAPEAETLDSIRWWLFLTSSDRRHLASAIDLTSRLRALAPAAEVGATIHGVSSIEEARRAYEHLARRCASELDVELKSYGLLVDDLDVYRAIAAQRPIGLAHPQAPATKALNDVARLLYDDARSQTLG